MILVRSSQKRKSIIKASPQDIKVNDMYWINWLNRVDIALSIQLFAASTETFESKQISAKDHGAYKNAFTGILRQRNMSIVGHLQKLRPHSVLGSVSPTDLASFTSFILACNSFFFSWAFRLQLIFVSLKEFHNSTCISQFLKLRTFYDAKQNLTISGKFFSIRYFNSVYLAYAASQNWCEQMQWQWRTMPIFPGKKILKS